MPDSPSRSSTTNLHPSIFRFSPNTASTKVGIQCQAVNQSATKKEIFFDDLTILLNSPIYKAFSF
ncbi:MAG: hypothetical protein HC894_17635 [Microcoleus sp. SM1_3_4]|nr:hypothetical protein [Microcoleus sp. SM1_3_4]